MRFKTQAKPQEDAHIDLTPMLDIVFILLIFFIVTSSLSQKTVLDVTPASAQHTTAMTTAQALEISIRADNSFAINGQYIDAERLKITLEQAYRQHKTSLIISADKAAQNGALITLMDTAKGVGYTQIALAAMQSNTP